MSDIDALSTVHICRSRHGLTLSQKISAFSRQVLWDGSDEDDPSSERPPQSGRLNCRAPLRGAHHLCNRAHDKPVAAHSKHGQLPLRTSPHGSKQHKGTLLGLRRPQAEQQGAEEDVRAASGALPGRDGPSSSSQARTSLSLHQDAPPKHAAGGPDGREVGSSRAMHQNNSSLHTTGRHSVCPSINASDRHVDQISAIAGTGGPLVHAPGRPDAHIAALACTQQPDGIQQGSPPGLERTEQVSMVPDTPASDGIRDSAPQQQTADIPAGSSRPSPAQQGLHMASAGIEMHVASSSGQQAPDLWHQSKAQLQVRRQDAVEKEPADAPPAANADASTYHLASAPELALDLGLSSRESQPLVATVGQGGITAVPYQWLSAACAAQPSPCNASHPSPAAAAAGPLSDGHRASSLRPSSDKETPLVQCAQLAANVSTDGSHAAPGTASKVRDWLPLYVLSPTMTAQSATLALPALLIA